MGHLASACHTKLVTNSRDANNPGLQNQRESTGKKSQGQPKRKFVRATQEDSDEEEDSGDQNGGREDNGYFVLPINSILEKDCFNFVVETQTVKMMPDTGTQVTLLPRNIYDKHSDIFPPLHKCSKPIYAYMSEEPLNVCGQFYGDVSEPVSGNKTTTRIVVIDGSGIPLLSKKDSVRLGIIKIGPQLASVQDGDIRIRMKSKHSKVFRKIPGKLNTRQH